LQLLVFLVLCHLSFICRVKGFPYNLVSFWPCVASFIKRGKSLSQGGERMTTLYQHVALRKKNVKTHFKMFYLAKAWELDRDAHVVFTTNLYISFLLFLTQNNYVFSNFFSKTATRNFIDLV
jgi:hypothetical protein